MPIAAVVGDRIFCCHGGLSPLLTGSGASLELIKGIERPTDIDDTGKRVKVS